MSTHDHRRRHDQAPILSLKGTMARFSGRAGDGLYVAIRDALVVRRLPLSFLATDAEEVSLDPHYVRCVRPTDRPTGAPFAGSSDANETVFFCRLDTTATHHFGVSAVSD